VKEWSKINFDDIFGNMDRDTCRKLIGLGNASRAQGAYVRGLLGDYCYYGLGWRIREAKWKGLRMDRFEVGVFLILY
jgi:hypothetical protein